MCIHSAKVTNKELLDSYQALFANKSFDPSSNLLIDLRRTDSSLRRRPALEQLALFVKSKYTGQSSSPRIGVIAPKDLSFGLARMYDSFAESIPWEFAVFRTLEETLNWLGVNEAALPDALKTP